MTLTTSLKLLNPDEALVLIEAGACYVDPRKVAEYLDVHVPGSLSLQYEGGPGLPGRARDCIPLSVPLVLLEEEGVDPEKMAAALRAKGFVVEGALEGGIKAWAGANGTPTSSDVLEEEPSEGTILHVNDPGVDPPEGAMNVPIEQLWRRVDEVPRHERITIAAGHGVRAAIGVGILERAGVEIVSFWWRRRKPVVGIEKKRGSFLRPFSN